MKKKGVSLISLIILVIVIILVLVIIFIRTKNNTVKQADVLTVKDMLNTQITDITVENMETPILYTDENYEEKVIDKVQINKESQNIGKLYYTTSQEKGCIVFGKSENQDSNGSEIKYRYTQQELPSYSNKTVKWYVTTANNVIPEI